MPERPSRGTHVRTVSCFPISRSMIVPSLDSFLRESPADLAVYQVRLAPSDFRMVAPGSRVFRRQDDSAARVLQLFWNAQHVSGEPDTPAGWEDDIDSDGPALIFLADRF